MRQVSLISAMFVMTAATLVSCGSPTSGRSTQLQSAAHTDPLVIDNTIAFPLKGDVQVRAGTAAVGSGLWTTLEIGFGLDCTHSLETFSYQISETAAAKRTVYVSAFATKPEKVKGPRCQGFSRETRTIDLNGAHSPEEIEVVFLDGAEKVVTEGTDALVVTPDLEIASVEPLCPIEHACEVGGTVVTVQARVGCFDELGPVVHAARQKIEHGRRGQLELSVAALTFADNRSQRADCANKPETHRIVLQDLEVDSIDDIELSVLR